MRDYFKVVTLTGALMVTLSVFSAGQATTGTVTVASNIQGSMTRHLVEWVSSDKGNVIYEGLATVGYLKHVEILSGGNSSTGVDTSDTPTNKYDVEILNDMYRDILATNGADVPTTSTGNTQTAPLVVIPTIDDGETTPVVTNTAAVHGKLTLNITNAGDTRKGWIALYFDRYR